MIRPGRPRRAIWMTTAASLFDMPTCRVCGRADEIDAFYKNQLRQCGEVGECKECTKARVRLRRAAHAEYYRAYDRARYRENDERKKQARKSAQSPAGMRSKRMYNQNIKVNHPLKYRARNAVSKAVRNGSLVRGTECYFCGCGGNLHAHHPDYSRPLDVFWLCPSCHGKIHTINGDFLRAAE